MDFNEYQAGVNATWRSTPRPLTFFEQQIMAAELGLSGETGEISENIKKGIFHEKAELLDKDLMCKELGDALYYLTKMGDLFGLTLEQIAAANNLKLAKRYPEGFRPGGGVRE